jgi:hypothetical protein
MSIIMENLERGEVVRPNFEFVQVALAQLLWGRR